MPKWVFGRELKFFSLFISVLVNKASVLILFEHTAYFPLDFSKIIFFTGKYDKQIDRDIKELKKKS